jgi:hypothetical protein
MRAELERYSDVKLSLRRPTKGSMRSEYEAEEDFQYMVKLKAEGATFDEITAIINSERDYYTTAEQNRALYFKVMRANIVKSNTEDAAETEKLRHLDTLGWVESEAMRMWQKLKEVQYQDEVSGKVIEEGQTTEEDDEGNEVPIQSKKYSKKKIGLVEQHQAKYLDLILKTVELRAKLMGSFSVDKAELDLIDILKNKILDDGDRPKGIKYTSEEEVVAAYLNVQPAIIIEDNLDIENEMDR